MTILIIEDDVSIRDNILELLSLKGFDVLEAENGVIGVLQAQQFSPDLILCDVKMPELDGFGVLAELQKDPGTAAIPFIFLTANAKKERLEQGITQGATAYLIKPFASAILLASIYQCLSKFFE